MVDLPQICEFEAAAERLRGVIVRTPLVPLHEDEPDSEIWLKVETLQPVTSFKIRGVFHAVALMGHEQRARGLSTVSAGNTAQALAWSARWFGVHARSLMPETAPRSKLDAVRRYGGEPVLVPVPELFRFLRERGWEREPYAFVHPWTDRNLMLGHGTIGLEIAADLPQVDTVYVPVGGGGLIAGIGTALKASGLAVRLVGVEPAGCPKLHESLKRGAPAAVDCRTELCDGVAVPYITDEMFEIVRELVEEVVLVPEEQVAAAIRRLALQDRLIVEGSAALSVAAALATPPRMRGRTVCMVTGGSIDTDKLIPILNG